MHWNSYGVDVLFQPTSSSCSFSVSHDNLSICRSGFETIECKRTSKYSNNRLMVGSSNRSRLYSSQQVSVASPSVTNRVRSNFEVSYSRFNGETSSPGSANLALG